jgi:hypothetical protein
VLSIAKLAGAITLSWWCVLAPAWIPVAPPSSSPPPWRKPRPRWRSK